MNIYKIIRLSWNKEQIMSDELDNKLRALNGTLPGMGPWADFKVVSHSGDGDGLALVVVAESRR